MKCSCNRRAICQRHQPEYRERWEPLGWSEIGFWSMHGIRPITGWDKEPTGNVPQPGYLHLVSLVSASLYPTTKPRVGSTVWLTVEEAEEWYEVIPGNHNVITLSNKVATMLWWGITPEDVRDYLRLPGTGVRSMRALDIFLWKRLPGQVTAKMTFEELSKIAREVSVDALSRTSLGGDAERWSRVDPIPAYDILENLHGIGVQPAHASWWTAQLTNEPWMKPDRCIKEEVIGPLRARIADGSVELDRLHQIWSAATQFRPKDDDDTTVIILRDFGAVALNLYDAVMDIRIPEEEFSRWMMVAFIASKLEASPPKTPYWRINRGIYSSGHIDLVRPGDMIRTFVAPLIDGGMSIEVAETWYGVTFNRNLPRK